MFKFFRSLRHRFASENKIPQYLTYAVGEIVLVVIGILIALAINSWNEKRKLIDEERIYLQNLKEDMKAQIDLLDLYIDFENIIIQHSNDIIEHYKANNGFYHMDSIFPKLHDLSTRWTFSNANTTLEQMLNSNKINIIRNRQLKEELIGFNQQINLFAINSNTNNTNLVDIFVTSYLIDIGSFASYGISDRMMKKFNDFYPLEINKVRNERLQNTSVQVINEPRNELELINKIVYRNTISSLQRSGNQALKKEAERILGLINNEIEKQ